MDYKKYIPVIEDFPIKGISFKDITPLLQNGEVFSQFIGEMCDFVKSVGATMIVGPESRGFIFGCPVASALKIGFVPVRKPGKLPREEISIDYELEYGINRICMHKDALKPGDKVVIVDDLIATGGTVEGTIKLCEQLGAKVVGVCVGIELTDLKGREHFPNIPFYTAMQYPF